jgi:hypothetical protein
MSSHTSTDKRPAVAMPSRLLLLAAASLTGCAALTCAPTARADVVAYLVNVTVRPGYNFANADEAIGYGRGICDKLTPGDGYSQLISNVEADFATTDEYQASYLISQAVNELCPASIWQLRNSAAHYHPLAP